MTAPLHVLFGVAAGALVAGEARRALKRVGDPARTRYFLVVAILAGAVVMPSGLVLYALYPDWSLMYLAHPGHLSPFLAFPALALAYLGAPPLGFFAALWLGARLRGVPGLLGGLAGAALLTFVLGARRIFTVAHYDAFHHRGFTLSLSDSALFLPLLLVEGAAVSVLVFAVLHVRRHLELSEDLPALRARGDETAVRRPVAPARPG